MSDGSSFEKLPEALDDMLDIVDGGSQMFRDPNPGTVTFKNGVTRDNVSKVLKEALANYGMFPTVEEGLNTVDELGAFTVLGEPGGEATSSSSNQEPFLTGYRKINGEAVKIGTLPSGTLINLFTMFFAWDELVDPNKIPVFIDRNGRVSVAIIDGKIWVTDFTGPATGRMLQQAELANNSHIPIAVDGAGRVGLAMIDDALWAQNLTGPVESRLLKTGEFLEGYTPIIVDKNNNVPLWVHHDELWWMGRNISDVDKSIENSRLETLTVTSGESLHQYRLKQAMLERGMDAKLKVMITGDSWTEYRPIPQAFADQLYDKYGQSGEGWIQLNIGTTEGLNSELNNIVVKRSKGWTIYDASATNNTPLYGTAHDGMCIYTTNTTDTIDATGITGETVHIYYRNVDGGAFRYRINDADWVTVNEAADGPSKITVSGLSGDSQSISIDTTVNAGTVVIYGFRSESDKSGVEIQKSGNAGISGYQWPKVIDQIGYFSKELNPDLLIVILGTNDYRLKRGVETYTDGLQQMINVHLIANPELGVIFISPDKSKPTVEPSLSDYRDAARRLAIDNGWEYISWFDYFPDEYSETNGLWLNDLHHNDLGATFGAKLTLNKLMGVY